MPNCLPKLALSLFLFSSVIFLAGCKQGLAERCQITDDCQSGLVCSPSDHTCREPVVDAFSADAGVDASEPDAAIDAAQPDANVADAADTDL